MLISLGQKQSTLRDIILQWRNKWAMLNLPRSGQPTQLMHLQFIRGSKKARKSRMKESEKILKWLTLLTEQTNKQKNPIHPSFFFPLSGTGSRGQKFK